MANGFNLKITNKSQENTKLQLFDTSQTNGTSTNLLYSYQYDYASVIAGGVFTLDEIGITLNMSTGLTTYKNVFGGFTPPLTVKALIVNLNDPAELTSKVGVWDINKNIDAALDAFPDSWNIQVLVFTKFGESIRTGTDDLGAKQLQLVGSGVAPTLTLNSTTAPYSTFTRSISANARVVVEDEQNIKYNQFNNSIAQRTYSIKKFEIYSANPLQVLEPFIFSRKLASGKEYDKVLVPTIDPYQNNNYIILKYDKGYVMDGFTELKYNVLADSDVRIILDYTFVDITAPLLLKKHISNDGLISETISNEMLRDNPELIREDLFIPTKDFIESSVGDTEGNIDETNLSGFRTQEVILPFR